MIIKNGTIYDAVNEKPYIADILIKDGKIAQIGENLSATDEEIIDASGKCVYPGLVDAHSHIGLWGYGAAGKDTDLNERNDILNPHVKGIDGFDPFDEGLKRAISGGVTTIGAGPGSAAIISGTFMAVKTFGTCVDDMCIKNDIAMKCALGENPKGVFGTKCDSARQTTAAKLREILINTRTYMYTKEGMTEEAKKTKFDMKLEAMIPVLKGEMPLKIHAHRADDILTAIRIAKEFDIKFTIEHCTEGHLIAEKIAEAGCMVAVGPLMLGATKRELVNKSEETAAVLTKAGVQVSMITDAPVSQQEHLAMSAGIAMKYGMSEFEALKTITINPANHLGVADRVGSLEAGKDADIVIADGNILLNTTRVLNVLIDGKIVL